MNATLIPTIQKICFMFLLLLSSSRTYAQSDSLNAMADIRKFQDELNTQYHDPKESPLGAEGAKKFKSHQFFPVDLKFRVIAILTPTDNTPFLGFKTSSTRLAEYRIYGMVKFTLEGKTFEVPIYQSASLLKTDEYKDYLFFPFTDLTNDKESYAAGRYIDIRIPKGSELIIDFNQAYNPYCAYRVGYSCPIVPSANHIDIPIKAGVMYIGKH